MIDFSQQKNALHLMQILEEKGYEARLVGGCVRDALLGKPMGDIDMATTASPEQVMAILSGQEIHVIPTGIKHGTVTAVLDKKPYEITTLRHDVTTDGRHAEVAFHDDWELDARRRDFTINAMSVDQKGQLFDYCDGQKDLKQKLLRFIDDPAKRIQEDYLRLLRYFRFASTLDWELNDQKTLQICKELAPNLTGLSRERIQAELYKLLQGPGCLRIVQQMADLGIWAQFISAAPDIDRLKTLQSNDPFLRLVALAGTDERALEKFIVLSREQKDRLKAFNEIDPEWPLHKLLYVYGPQSVSDYAQLHQKDWQIVDWQHPVFPLKAEHVMPFTNGPGKQVGELMKQAENWWIDQAFKPTLEQILEHFHLVR